MSLPRILVIPSQFPRFQGDIRGVFIVDYLRTIKETWDIAILDACLTDYPVDPSLVQDISIDAAYVRQPRYHGWKKHRKLVSYILLVMAARQEGIKLAKTCKLIHAHGVFPSGILAWMISRKYGIPYLITEHTGPFSKIASSFFNRNLASFVYRNSSVVLAVSNDLQRQIIDSPVHAEKLVVTYNPVDTDLFSLRHKDQKKRRFLFAGRLVPYKGGLRVIKAFDRLVKEYQNWSCTIIGDGPEMSAIKAYIEEHPDLNGRVEFRGMVDKETLAKEMQEHCFFAFPSEHETFGLTAAEALSCGLPVIAGSGTAFDEYIDESNGILVKPNDIAALEKAIEYMILHWAEYPAEEIREQIVNRFGFKAFGERLNKIYCEVAECAE